MATRTFIMKGPVDYQVTLTELDDGSILVEIVPLDGNTKVGDLRGLFFDFFDDSLVSGLSVTGDDVTDHQFLANGVNDLGDGVNINGKILNKHGAYDGGIEIGYQGLTHEGQDDDIQSTSFIISHDTVDLTVDMFGDFAIRVTSVGKEGGAREASFKSDDKFEPPQVNVDDGMVDEAGLPEGSDEVLDGVVGNDNVDSEYESGDISVNVVVDKVEIQDASGTWFDVTETPVPVQIQGLYGILTVSWDPVTGYSYDYELTGNTTDHPDDTSTGTDEGIFDRFDVRATDTSENLSATDTIDIAVKDDGPTAFDDDFTQASENQPVSGNVITNDTFGADGDKTDPQVSLISDVAEGSLTLNTDGTFTFTPDPGQEGQVSFTYQIIDSDGDVSQAVATITLKPDSEPEFAVEPSDVYVDEDGLEGGDGPAGSNQDSGSVKIDFGNDSAGASFQLDLTGLDGQLQTPDGTPVTFAYDGNDLVGSAAGSEVIRISPTLTDNGDGTWTVDYDVTLSGPVEHVAGNGENNETLTVLFSGADGDDGDPYNGSFDVVINDDTPEAVNDDFTQASENQPVSGNVITNDTFGADGDKTDPQVSLISDVAEGSLTLNPDGTFTFTPDPGQEGQVSFTYQIIDSDGDVSQATATITLLTDSEPDISILHAVVDEDGLSPDGNGDAPATDTTTMLVDFYNDQPGDLLGAVAFDASSLPSTGTFTSDGSDIAFAIEGGAIVGRNVDTTDVVITITISNPVPKGAGQVEYDINVVLSGPFDHGVNPGEGDLDVLLSSLQVTVTDSDGDENTGSFNVRVLDDAPASLDPDVLMIQNFAPSETSGDLNFAVGGDGLGGVSFNAQTGDLLFNNDNPPSQLYSGGEALRIVIVNATTLWAVTENDYQSDAYLAQEYTGQILTVTLDAENGTWSAQIAAALQTEAEILITDFEASIGGGNVPVYVIDNELGGANDTDLDIILQGVETGVGPTSVNTSQGKIGVGTGNDVDENDIIHIKFVSGVTQDDDPNNEIGLTWDELRSTDTFKQQVTRITGDKTADIRVYALTDNTKDGATDDRTDGILANDPDDEIVPITGWAIYDENNELVDPADYAGLNIDIVENDDGSITFVNFPEGYWYQITTDAPFNAVEVSKEPGDTGADDFTLGAFSLGGTIEVSPFDVSLDITGVDNDGDPIDGDLTLTVAPAGLNQDVPTANDDLIVQNGEFDQDPGTDITFSVIENDDAGNDGVNLSDGGITVEVDHNGSGVLDYNEDGTFTYTPGDGEIGPVTFQYRITDVDGGSDTATVTLNLDEPVAMASISMTSEAYEPVLITSEDSFIDGETGITGGGHMRTSGFLLDEWDSIESASDFAMMSVMFSNSFNALELLESEFSPSEFRFDNEDGFIHASDYIPHLSDYDPFG